MSPTSQPTAFSYIRFSHPDQAKGDSLRRQTEAAAAWCERNNVTLDRSITLRDLGKSAFRGAHHKDDRHALGAFIKLAESGRVPPDSYLIIERLDRLTREDVNDALELFLRLKKLVRIVQLSPVEVIHDRHSNPMQLMMALVELMRGRDESEAKSDRNGKTWAEKRRRAREKKPQPPRRKDGRVTMALTGRLPRWVEDAGGKLRLVPERAAVVRRVFQLSAAGRGHSLIVKALTEDNVPAFGDSGRWTRAYVAAILADRRALGELQPRLQDGTPDGEPIRDYYPAVVTEAEWLAGRAEAKRRRNSPGRVGRHVNLFQGLLRDALTGGTYFATTRGKSPRRPGGPGPRWGVLVNTEAAEGRGRVRAFPLGAFERAVLSKLREVDPHEILNGDDGPDETLVLAGELARVEAKIAALEAELLEGDVAALARVLRQLEGQKRDLGAKLAAARQKAAHPLSEAWGEALTLAEALDTAPDPVDARLRLRSALRRIVSEIRLLVVPRGRDRLAAVQIWFAADSEHAGRHRDYLILHQPPKANGKTRTEGGTWTRSLADTVALSPLDLRDPEHARRLAAALEQAPLHG
jgi:DNA invertase Pin-like site-specific DNA recombinase